MQKSNLLDKEELFLCNKLSKLNSEINDLQINKTQLDEIKCKLETDVDNLTEKTSEYILLIYIIIEI